MPDARTLHHVLMDMENVHRDLRGLAAAIATIGTYFRIGVENEIEAVSTSSGAGIEVLGEIIGERTAHLVRLLDEGLTLRTGGARG